MIRSLTLRLLFCAVIALPADAAPRQDFLDPDLTFHFECHGGSPSESAIEGFLKSHGFEVANDERVRRQLAPGLFPLQIESLDARNWSVDFQGLRIPADTPAGMEMILYTVVINSPPPTHHDEVLENATTAFVSGTLGCPINSRSRLDNGPDAREFFEFLLAAKKDRMHEAAVCDRTEVTYDAAACSKFPQP